MGAEVAFGGCIVVGIYVEGIVRAGLHTALAADTSLVVKIDDSIRTAVEGFGGADGYAGSRIAVVTSHHAEVAPGMRIYTFLDVLDPGAKHAHRNLVLLFTGYRTGVTANTSVLIDDESIAHEVLYSSSQDVRVIG
jgi:hypothetical protein